MESLTLIPSKFLIGSSNLTETSIRRSLAAPQSAKRREFRRFKTKPLITALARRNHGGTSQRFSKNALERLDTAAFASISSSSTSETTSIGVNPPSSVPPPPSTIGSPLFWIGVGVGLSALFSWVATRVKNYAMQQAFKTMMNQMPSSNGQFSNAAFSQGSPFPFPTASSSTPAAPSPAPPSSSPVVTVDVPARQVDHVTEVRDDKAVSDTRKEPKKFAFVDVSPEVLQKETLQKESAEANSSEDASFSKQVSANGALPKQESSSNEQSQATGKPGPGSVWSVDALEKMMEDPTVQKMVYPVSAAVIVAPLSLLFTSPLCRHRRTFAVVVASSVVVASPLCRRCVTSFITFAIFVASRLSRRRRRLSAVDVAFLPSKLIFVVDIDLCRRRLKR